MRVIWLQNPAYWHRGKSEPQLFRDCFAMTLRCLSFRRVPANYCRDNVAAIIKIGATAAVLSRYGRISAFSLGSLDPEIYVY